MPGIVSLPMIALRGMTAFPHLSMSFDIGRPKSVIALNAAMERDHRLFLVAQRDPSLEEPEKDDLCRWGTIVRIKQIVRPKDENIKLLVEGIERAYLEEITEKEGYVEATVQLIECNWEKAENDEIRARMRSARHAFDEYVDLTHMVSPNIINRLDSIEDPDLYADLLIGHAIHDQSKLQKLLEITDPGFRLETFEICVRGEMELIKLEISIQNRVQEQLAKYQKDAFLNEQMKVIRQELGQYDEEENQK